MPKFSNLRVADATGASTGAEGAASSAESALDATEEEETEVEADSFSVGGAGASAASSDLLFLLPLCASNVLETPACGMTYGVLGENRKRARGCFVLK